MISTKIENSTYNILGTCVKAVSGFQPVKHSIEYQEYQGYIHKRKYSKLSKHQTGDVQAFYADIDRVFLIVSWDLNPQEEQVYFGRQGIPPEVVYCCHLTDETSLVKIPRPHPILARSKFEFTGLEQTPDFGLPSLSTFSTNEKLVFGTTSTHPLDEFTAVKTIFDGTTAKAVFGGTASKPSFNAQVNKSFFDGSAINHEPFLESTATVFGSYAVSSGGKTGSFGVESLGTNDSIDLFSPKPGVYSFSSPVIIGSAGSTGSSLLADTEFSFSSPSVLVSSPTTPFFRSNPFFNKSGFVPVTNPFSSKHVTPSLVTCELDASCDILASEEPATPNISTSKVSATSNSSASKAPATFISSASKVSATSNSSASKAPATLISPASKAPATSNSSASKVPATPISSASKVPATPISSASKVPATSDISAHKVRTTFKSSKVPATPNSSAYRVTITPNSSASKVTTTPSSSASKVSATHNSSTYRVSTTSNSSASKVTTPPSNSASEVTATPNSSASEVPATSNSSAPGIVSNSFNASGLVGFTDDTARLHPVASQSAIKFCSPGSARNS